MAAARNVTGRGFDCKGNRVTSQIAELQVRQTGGLPHRGSLTAADQWFACALGRSGLARDKREGDGATPIGRFRLRRVLYRPDRLAEPPTSLPVSAIAPDDGWCDSPADPAYNRQVRLPYAGGAEGLWRKDRLYDILVVLGHNDEPVVAGRGSAIFFHLALPEYAPTSGCVAVVQRDMLDVLSRCGPSTVMTIEAKY